MYLKKYFICILFWTKLYKKTNLKIEVKFFYNICKASYFEKQIKYLERSVLP